MTAIAQSLSQSMAGLFREVGEPLSPASAALAPPTVVDSPSGEFQIVTSPTFPRRQNPVGEGPMAEHPLGTLTYSKVAYALGDPYLGAAYPVTDREVNALLRANRALSITQTTVNAIRRQLLEQHAQDSVTAAAAFAAGTTIDCAVPSTDLINIFRDAKRSILNSRGLGQDTQLVLTMNRAAADRIGQFDQVMGGPAIAGAASGGTFRRLGTVAPDFLERWFADYLRITLVVDDTLHLATAGTLTYTQSLAYLAVAAGGEAPSALKTLYLPMEENEFDPAANEADTVEAEGLLRINVTRNTGRAQAGWTVKGDGHWRIQMFDASLGRKFTLNNVPAA